MRYVLAIEKWLGPPVLAKPGKTSRRQGDLDETAGAVQIWDDLSKTPAVHPLKIPRFLETIWLWLTVRHGKSMKIYPFLIGEPSINGPFSMISMAMLVITRWYHWDPDVTSGDFRTGSDAGARFVRPSLGMSWLSVSRFWTISTRRRVFKEIIMYCSIINDILMIIDVHLYRLADIGTSCYYHLLPNFPEIRAKLRRWSLQCNSKVGTTQQGMPSAERQSTLFGLRGDEIDG